MAEVIRLVVFLGNPGHQYSETRHNVGWMLLDALPKGASLVWREKFHGRYADCGAGSGKVRFLRPHTSMNLSGKSVSAAMDFYRLNPSELLVVHDEIELAFGTIGRRFGGGLAGHKGLRSIRDFLGTSDFHRLRIGIGRPERGSVHSWVLGRFDPVEKAALPAILGTAGEELLAALPLEIFPRRSG